MITDFKVKAELYLEATAPPGQGPATDDLAVNLDINDDEHACHVSLKALMDDLIETLREGDIIVIGECCAGFASRFRGVAEYANKIADQIDAWEKAQEPVVEAAE